MTETHPYFFGYGSLVNRLTHAYAPTHPARARGWRRLWRHTAQRDLAILAAIPAPGEEIEGLIAPVPDADWRALDLREAAYDRRLASADILHGLAAPAEIAIYTIPETKHPPADSPRPILRSYLEVVVQGYLREFGPEGVARFFDTTDGWDAPLLDDRAAPRYPRAQAISEEETALTDFHLARVRQ